MCLSIKQLSIDDKVKVATNGLKNTIPIKYWIFDFCNRIKVEDTLVSTFENKTLLFGIEEESG